MKITRKQILQAIRKEPLKANDWIHGRWKYDKNGESEWIEDKNCKVCAVGAVLRNAGVANEKIGVLAYGLMMNQGPEPSEHGNEKEALKEGYYLHALSIKFEKLAKRLGAGKRTRYQLATFVKKNFPTTINVR